MELPKDAKRVFKGVIFDVYQWEQEMFDGSKATFEKIKRPATVQVIPIVDGKIVLSQEQQPDHDKAWTVFGGRQEEGEEPLETAKRELLEETGFVSDDWQLIRTLHPSGKGKILWELYVYVARNCTKIQEPQLDAGERITMHEVDFDRFVDIVVNPSFWGETFSNELYRMRAEGRLEGFKNELFGDGGPT